MQLELERGRGNVVESCADGAIRVAGRIYTEPLILTPEQLIDGWRVPEPRLLTIADLEPALALEPEVIVLGTGPRQQFPAARIVSEILGRGVGFEVMAAHAACRTYNVLAGEYRRVVAALYPR